MIDKALKEFIEQWKYKENVVGILLCGSYAVNLNNKKSDIDIRLILDDKNDLNFKGLQNIRGYSFSYLGRSNSSIISKFNNDFYNNSKIEVRNFYFGKILFECENSVTLLKNISKYYFEIEFIPQNFDVEHKKDLIYSIYSHYNCLMNRSEDSIFFKYNYYRFLYLSIFYYGRILGVELSLDLKIEKFLFDEQYIKKYNLMKFPDEDFLNLWKYSIIETNINKQTVVKLYKYLNKVIYSINPDNFIMYWK